MEPLKEMFNADYFKHLSTEIYKVENNFDKGGFLRECTRDLEKYSLNERMRRASMSMKNFLPGDFKQNVEILKKVIPNTRKGYTNLVFPDFVGLFGLNDLNTSLNALKYFTTFGSSEFAIRQFLKNDFDATFPFMVEWSKDPDHHVRRLSSEGSRARLPWSLKLDRVLADPSCTKPILENLKSDPELYVRKSVANHLNDFSKIHPDYMIGLFKSWDISDPHTGWIIKHASRTLIKNGHPASLAVFKFEKKPKVAITKFKIKTPVVKLGTSLEFEFVISSEKSADQKLVVDYIIHYKKQSGTLSPKVFKLKEFVLGAQELVTISKKQLIKDFTTRKHFAGKHLLQIQVNGTVLIRKSFNVSI